MVKESRILNKTVLVCKSRTCRSSGSLEVLKAFQTYSLTGITVIGCGCLGQCGNGPMVLILPEETWYSNICVNKVPTIIEQDLQEGKPVRSMLYRKFHQ